jgi:hypothetical protein
LLHNERRILETCSMESEMFERQIADAVSRRMPPHHLRRILDVEPRDLCSILRSSGLQWNGERYSRIETERDDDDDGVPGLRPGVVVRRDGVVFRDRGFVPVRYDDEVHEAG